MREREEIRDFSYINFQVQAREVDTNPIRSSEPITITIHILDANDNSPEFEQSIYTANTTAHGGVRPIVKVGNFSPEKIIYKFISKDSNYYSSFHGTS